MSGQWRVNPGLGRDTHRIEVVGGLLIANASI